MAGPKLPAAARRRERQSAGGSSTMIDAPRVARQTIVWFEFDVR